MNNSKEARVSEIVEWLKIKGVEVDERDIKTFQNIISLARNDGYREATGLLKDSEKEEDL